MYNKNVEIKKEKFMATTHIQPNFELPNEGNIMRIVGLLTIFFSFIPPLIAYFGLTNNLSPEGKAISAELTNFNVVGVIALIVCSVVPIIGWLLFPLVWIYFLVMDIIIAVQIVNGPEVKIPIILQILK